MPSQDDELERSSAETCKGIGVFRDRKSLVLSRAGFSLPDVCLKSGEPTKDRYHLKTRVLNLIPTMIFHWLLGGLGADLAARVFGTPFDLKLPLRSDWNAPDEVRSPRGWIIVLLGIGVIVLGIGLSAVSESLMAVCVIGIVIAVIGFFVGGVTSSVPFEIKKFNDQYVWISGVSPEALEGFELLPNSGP